MLVILEPNTPDSVIEAVRDRAAALGLDTVPFATNGSYTLLISGDNAADAAWTLGALPGVTEVVPAEAGARPVTSNLRIAGIRPLVPPGDPRRAIAAPRRGRSPVHRSAASCAASCAARTTA